VRSIRSRGSRFRIFPEHVSAYFSVASASVARQDVDRPEVVSRLPLSRLLRRSDVTGEELPVESSPDVAGHRRRARRSYVAGYRSIECCSQLPRRDESPNPHQRGRSLLRKFSEHPDSSPTLCSAFNWSRSVSRESRDREDYY